MKKQAKTAALPLSLLQSPGYPALSTPHEPENWNLLLERHFLALDNHSRLTPDMVDALSGVITGAAPQRRRLHGPA